MAARNEASAKSEEEAKLRAVAEAKAKAADEARVAAEERAKAAEEARDEAVVEPKAEEEASLVSAPTPVDAEASVDILSEKEAIAKVEEEVRVAAEKVNAGKENKLLLLKPRNLHLAHF
jgi:colicin import membrane protein